MAGHPPDCMQAAVSDEPGVKSDTDTEQVSIAVVAIDHTIPSWSTAAAAVVSALAPSRLSGGCPSCLLLQTRAPGMPASKQDKRSLTWSQISKSLCAGGVAGAV